VPEKFLHVYVTENVSMIISGLIKIGINCRGFGR
jgi:hypothetical protein